MNDIKLGKHQGIGRRPLLEDRADTESITTAGGIQLSMAIVADGIGGENAGERAAELTIETFFDVCKSSSEKNIPKLLRSALEKANDVVYQEAQRLRKTHNEMGCTAVVAAIHDGQLYIANIGDSRAYLVRGQSVSQLTSDHTWGNEMIRSGKRTSAEVARHPKRDEITRSIGYESAVKVDLEISPDANVGGQGIDLRPGDQIVVCSDGLIKTGQSGKPYVSDVEIAKIVNGSLASDAAKKLVALAVGNGTDDNVSVAILAVPGGKTPIIDFPGIPRPVLFAIGGGVAALGAFVCVAAVKVQFLSNQTPAFTPTPTIPAFVVESIAYVSVLDGKATSILVGKERSLKEGDIIQASVGSLVRVQEGYIKLALSDGGIVFVEKGSEIEIRQIANKRDSKINDTIIQLNYGRVVVDIKVSPGKKFFLQAKSGARAEVIGSILGGRYDPTKPYYYEVHCYQGLCRLIGRNNNNQRDLQTGGGAFIDFDDNPVLLPGNDICGSYCPPIPTFTPKPPTATGTTVPTLPPTPTRFQPPPPVFTNTAPPPPPTSIPPCKLTQQTFTDPAKFPCP